MSASKRSYAETFNTPVDLSVRDSTQIAKDLFHLTIKETLAERPYLKEELCLACEVLDPSQHRKYLSFLIKRRHYM